MNGKFVVDVSIVAANYNNGPYLDDFFSAIQRSTAEVAELIFVDDGSTDNSLEIARRYRGKIPNLVLIELGRNRGFGNALNAGIEAATSGYIMRIDPDDIPMDNRIERQFNYIKSHNLDVVGSNARIFHSITRKIIGNTNFPITHEQISKAIKKGEHGVLHPTVLAKASFFKSNEYIQENVPAEDYDIFARFLQAGAKFGNIRDELLMYRVHQKSASNVLPYSTIKKTYELRDRIFGTDTSLIKVVLYYVHIKAYREYLFSVNRLKKYVWAAVCVCTRPEKFLRRGVRLLGSATRRVQASKKPRRGG